MNIDRGSIDLLDTEKVVLSISAKDLGGAVRAIPADSYSWTSSDTNIIALENSPDGVDDAGNAVPGDPYTRVARTPNPGSAVVTVTGPTGDTEQLTLNVKISGPGEAGLSAGTPIPE